MLFSPYFHAGEGETQMLASSCLQMYQWKNGTKQWDFLYQTVREKVVNDPQLTSFAYMSVSSFQSLWLSQHSGCESTSRWSFYGLQMVFGFCIHQAGGIASYRSPSRVIISASNTLSAWTFSFPFFSFFFFSPLNVMQVQQVFPYKLTARTNCFQMCLVHLYKV